MPGTPSHSRISGVANNAYPKLIGRGATLAPIRVDDWSRLPSAAIEVRRYGTFVRTGIVDAATPDSRMLWLSPEGVDSRVLFDKLDGYEAWIHQHPSKW